MSKLEGLGGSFLSGSEIGALIFKCNLRTITLSVTMLIGEVIWGKRWLITCGEEEMLAKEEVVKLLASQEQGGRLHYPPGMCRISCKATCKEVVLSVRKLTLQVLRSVWKAACLMLSPGSPVFNFGLLVCVRSSLLACAGLGIVLTRGVFFFKLENFANTSLAPFIAGKLMVWMWVPCGGYCASKDTLLWLVGPWCQVFSEHISWVIA